MHYAATGAKLDQKGNERSEAQSLFCALTLHCITLKPGFHDRQPSARRQLFMLTIHALSVNVLLERLPTLSLTIGVTKTRQGPYATHASHTTTTCILIRFYFHELIVLLRLRTEAGSQLYKVWLYLYKGV